MKEPKKTRPVQAKEDKAFDFLDDLLVNYKGPGDVLGENGLLKTLTKKIVEKAMKREIAHHLGYEKHDISGYNNGNSRNGYNKKTVKSDYGEIDISTPRDREGTFEPQILPKGTTHFSGFDDIILGLYTRGLTTRQIQDFIKELYKVDVSPDLISNVTDGVMEEITEWQNRTLEKVYPIVYLDALMVKIKDEGHIINKAVYLVIGLNLEGKKDLLGLWIQQTEGAKFWMRVITDLQNRGVEDIFIACVDGLKGFPEAIHAIFPKTQIQLCIVHMIRNSLKYVCYKQRKEVATDLKLIYSAVTCEKAEQELKSFGKKWDDKYPTISEMWRRNWTNISTFFAYDKAIRKAIYTTNVIESTNYSLRKVSKTRGSFPTDEAALKILYLGIKKLSTRWTMPIRDWGKAINQFAILFGDRVPLYGAQN